MCFSNGTFKETMACKSDEWCTGPSTEKTAFLLMGGTDSLCEQGKKLLVEKILSFKESNNKYYEI